MKTRTLTTSSLVRLLGCALMVPVACIAQDSLIESFERDMNRTPTYAPVDMALWSGENAPYHMTGNRYASQGSDDQIAASFERDMNRTPTYAPVDMALWSGENAPYHMMGSRYAGQDSDDQIAASFERDMHRTPTRDSVVSVERGTDPLYKLINMALWSWEDSLQLATSEIPGNVRNRGL